MSIYPTPRFSGTLPALSGQSGYMPGAFGVAGQVLTSNGPGVVPTFKTAPIAIWTTINANQTAAVGQGYFCNKAGTLTLALPATSAVGDVIEVAKTKGCGSWQLILALADGR